MIRSPRILHLQSGDGVSGGIAGYVASLVGSAALHNYTFTVTVGLGETDKLCESRKYHDAQVVETAPTYGIGSFPVILRHMQEILRENDVDLVHSHALRSGFICAILNLLYGVRYVHTNHGLRFHQKSGALTRLIFRQLEFFVIRRAELVLCIRKSDAALLGRIAPAQAHKIETITTRISVAESRRPAADTGAQRRLPVLIGVGSLIDVKRVDQFIDWLAALSSAGVEYEALWLGDGPLRREMEQRAAAANVAVSWRGQVEAGTVAAEFTRADLMLLTSELEVLSLAALEAMAKSTPIITTDFFGVSDFVVDGESGLVFSSGIPVHDIANSIAALLEDGSRIDSMRHRARSIFEAEFADAEKMAGEYAGHYRSLLK